jgi:hypothetical protein
MAAAVSTKLIEEIASLPRQAENHAPVSAAAQPSKPPHALIPM